MGSDGINLGSDPPSSTLKETFKSNRYKIEMVLKEAFSQNIISNIAICITK